MMQLLEWIEKRGFTQKEVAAGTGLSQSRLCRILKGSDPLMREVLKIEDFTHRRVTAKDWIDRIRKK